MKIFRIVFSIFMLAAIALPVHAAAPIAEQPRQGLTAKATHAIREAKRKAMHEFDESIKRFKKCVNGQCSKTEALKVARDVTIAAGAVITAAFVVTVGGSYVAGKTLENAVGVSSDIFGTSPNALRDTITTLKSPPWRIRAGIEQRLSPYKKGEIVYYRDSSGIRHGEFQEVTPEGKISVLQGEGAGAGYNYITPREIDYYLVSRTPFKETDYVGNTVELARGAAQTVKTNIKSGAASLQAGATQLGTTVSGSAQQAAAAIKAKAQAIHAQMMAKQAQPQQPQPPAAPPVPKLKTVLASKLKIGDSIFINPDIGSVSDISGNMVTLDVYEDGANNGKQILIPKSQKVQFIPAGSKIGLNF